MIFNALEIGLLVTIIICFIIQLLYYWMILAKPYFYMRSQGEDDFETPMNNLPPVSIIISVIKSNYDLSKFLTNILEQNYPEFEVIVVADRIYDDDAEVLKQLKTKYPNLYSTHVPEDTRNVSRKKLALTLGIKASKYDKLLFTEPDCYVKTEYWIRSMSRNFSDKKNIILGVSAVEKTENTLQQYFAYDFFLSNLQMISLALMDRPYAGDGRNLAYSKKHFIEQKGFVKHRLLQKGEDDLFVNEIATKENTSVELSVNSIVITEINDYRDWKRQKVDRMSTKRFYKRGPVALWRFETFIRIVFYIAIIACIVCSFPYNSISNYILTGVALLCFTVRLFSHFFVINKTLEYFKLDTIKLKLILFDFFQPYINLYFFIYLLFREKENYTYRYENR